MKKKILCIIVSIAVLLSIVSISAYAFVDTDSLYSNDDDYYNKTIDNNTVNENKIGNCVWNFDEHTGILSISGKGYMYTFDDLEGEPSPWYSINDRIKQVTINEGITGIPNEAFYDCKNMERIVLPTSLKNIGDNSFYDCEKLSEISLNNIEHIGRSAFFDCAKLNNISLNPKSIFIGRGAFYGTAYYNNQNNWIDDLLYLKNCLLDSKYSISGQVKIKNGTTSIAEGAFSERKNITSVIIPESICILLDNTFEYCKNLKKVILSNNVTSIGYMTFSHCSSLNYIKLSEKLQGINSHAFGSCTSLTSIYIPENIKRINAYAFLNCKRLKTVYYASSTKHWKKIMIDEGNDDLLCATTLCNIKSKGNTILNPIKIKSLTKKISATKLQKRTQKIKPFIIKYSQGKLSYKLIKKGTNKKILKRAKISQKGIITISKGKLKKGKYIIKVLIKDKGNEISNSKKIIKKATVAIK